MNPLDIVFILAVVGILFYLYWRLRPGSVSKRLRPEAVYYILLDIRLNRALAEVLHKLEKPKQFEMTGWSINKNRIGFLPKEIKDDLSATFTLAADFNKKIQTFRKAKDRDYEKLDLSNLKELFDKRRDELEDWLEKNTGSREWKPKPPSMSSLMLGER